MTESSDPAALAERELVARAGVSPTEVIEREPYPPGLGPSPITPLLRALTAPIDDIPPALRIHLERILGATFTPAPVTRPPAGRPRRKHCRRPLGPFGV